MTLTFDFLTPAYVRMQVHVWPELGKIAFIGMGDMVSSACRDLDLWPFDVISISQAQVHTWPNFDEMSLNIYENIAFTLFFGSLPAVTPTFDLLT